MDEKLTFRPFLLPVLILILVGWAGLVLLTNFLAPTLWARWGFFALVVVAVTGTALPLVYLLNLIFKSRPPVEPRVITRQALWFGVYFAVLAWLSVGRLLNFSVGLWLGLGFAAIEYLLRIRETSATQVEDHVPPQPPVS